MVAHFANGLLYDESLARVETKGRVFELARVRSLEFQVRSNLRSAIGVVLAIH